LLKLHHLYFIVFFVFFFALFVVIGVEVYYIKNFKEFLIYLTLTFILFIFIFFVITTKTSKYLQKEILKITNFLKNLTKKNKVEKIESNFIEEFNKITKLLSKVAHILNVQEKQKNAYTSKLETLNTQKDEIISAISHEFKNPIAVISGYSETLLKDDNIPIPLRKKFLQKIYNNSNKLTKLIDTLRLAIRLEENKQSYNFSEVDVCDLVDEIVEDIKESYDREIEIDKRVCSKIKADYTLLGVAIRNLIENGIKYSEDKIIIKIYNDGLSVEDNGIGLSEDDIHKITDKFYRVSNNTWNNSLGLGLSIVSNILKLHNFKLEIRSEIHNGSEFIIRWN